MTGSPDPGTRAALAGLRFGWGRAYVIDHVGGTWTAESRSRPAVLSARSAEALGVLIRDDRVLHPSVWARHGARWEIIRDDGGLWTASRLENAAPQPITATTEAELISRLHASEAHVD
jgi:hypothetical protein